MESFRSHRQVSLLPSLWVCFEKLHFFFLINRLQIARDVYLEIRAPAKSCNNYFTIKILTREIRFLSVIIYLEIIEILTVGKDCVSRHRRTSSWAKVARVFFPDDRRFQSSFLLRISQRTHVRVCSTNTCASGSTNNSRTDSRHDPRALSRSVEFIHDEISFRDSNRKDLFAICMS